MIVFLYGPDSYRRLGMVRYYRREFSRKYPLGGIGVFESADADSRESLSIFLRNPSLFDSRKLAIVDCNLPKEADQALLSALLAPYVKASHATVLVSFEKRPVKSLLSLAKKAFKVYTFPLLEGYVWELFIRSEAKNRSLRLTDDVVRSLALAYAGDSWGIVTELDKLRGSEKTTIDRHDLLVADIGVTPNFWSLLGGLQSQNTERRLVALERIFSTREPMGRIFHTIAYQDAKKTPIFAEYDVLFKSGKIDYEEALLDFVLR